MKVATFFNSLDKKLFRGWTGPPNKTYHYMTPCKQHVNTQDIVYTSATMHNITKICMIHCVTYWWLQFIQVSCVKSERRLNATGTRTVTVKFRCCNFICTVVMINSNTKWTSNCNCEWLFYIRWRVCWKKSYPSALNLIVTIQIYSMLQDKTG